MGYSYDLFLRNSNIFIEAQHATAATRILEDAMFTIKTDEKGNIKHFDFDGNSMPDDEEFCKALAPFMRDDCFLEFCNEMGDNWRWVFADGNCKRVSAVVLWPKPDAPPGIQQFIQKAFGPHLMTE